MFENVQTLLDGKIKEGENKKFSQEAVYRRSDGMITGRTVQSITVITIDTEPGRG